MSETYSEQQFVHEYDVKERVIGEGPIIATDPLLKRDPVERFMAIASAVFNEVNSRLSKKYMKVNLQDLINIAREEEEDIIYKNPTAYVLGYIVSVGGLDINVDILNKILLKKNSYRLDQSVKPPDIIRYARYFIKNAE